MCKLYHCDECGAIIDLDSAIICDDKLYCCEEHAAYGGYLRCDYCGNYESFTDLHEDYLDRLVCHSCTEDWTLDLEFCPFGGVYIPHRFCLECDHAPECASEKGVDLETLLFTC